MPHTYHGEEDIEQSFFILEVIVQDVQLTRHMMSLARTVKQLISIFQG